MITNALLLTLSLSALDPALVDATVGKGGSMGDHARMELAASHLFGTRPVASGDEEFSQNLGWFRFRVGSLTETTTTHGAQVGAQMHFGLGLIRPEDPKITSTTLFAFNFGADALLRFYTFNWPRPGALTGLAGLQLQFGGGHWWSDGRDTRFNLGLRLATALTDTAGLELEYVVAPFIFDLWLIGDDPGHGAEHRATLRLVFGEFVVGAELSQAWTQKLAGDAPAGWGDATALTGILGLRQF